MQNKLVQVVPPYKFLKNYPIYRGGAIPGYPRVNSVPYPVYARRGKTYELREIWNSLCKNVSINVKDWYFTSGMPARLRRFRGSPSAEKPPDLPILAQQQMHEPIYHSN